jgi:hypothetical protein
MADRRQWRWQWRFLGVAFAALVVSGATAPVRAQAAPDAPKKEKKAKAPRDSAAAPDTEPRKLFRDKDKPLTLTITTDLKKFWRMRERGRPPIPATMQYSIGDSAGPPLTVQVATRGNFRLKERNCGYPPVRLLFDSTSSTKKSLWAGQKRLKLVTKCDDRKEYEQYILQEYALYDAYNMLTPFSFRARLVKATYRDTLGKEKPVSSYAFLLEDDSDMAKRNSGKITDAKNAVFDDLDPKTTSILGVWQYMIGNTDFSIGAQHNIKLVLPATDPLAFPVAYDFDFSGAVNTRYSTPDPMLKIRTVRDRLYRGRCMNAEELKGVTELFNAKKAAIYAIYDRLPDLDKGTIKETKEFFDDFYQTLNDPRAAKRRLLDDCQPIGN